jgi:hypothetical protein
VKLWEGLLWIGRGCGGLPMVDKEVAGEELERRRRSEARGEMRVQERANWREGEPLKVLNQQRRIGEARTAQATTAARWRPGRARAEAGQCGARGRRPEEEN